MELKCFQLDLLPYSDKHTAQNIQDVLCKSFKKWDIDLRKMEDVFLTTDNAANMVAAVKLNGKWTRVPCFGHSAQLVIKDAIKVRHSRVSPSKFILSISILYRSYYIDFS